MLGVNSKASNAVDSEARAPVRDYEQLAVELIRALRGRRSCAELSRRGGYRSNAVRRWENRQCWPTTAKFLALRSRLRADAPSWIERFFKVVPSWARGLSPDAPAAVAAFLTRLKGNTPILRIAEAAQRNRYTVSRWLDGSAEPKLPDFLRLVDVSSRRLLDLVAALAEPGLLPSLRDDWAKLQRMRQAAYEMPWSHGVLRALELRDIPRGAVAQRSFIAKQLNIPDENVVSALEMLASTGQVNRTRAGYSLRGTGTLVDTSEDPERAKSLKAAWTRTALERLETGSPGRYGYSVFAVSSSDLEQIHQLHLNYVRAMQAVIARSSPSDCVALYCSQLVDLGSSPEE